MAGLRTAVPVDWRGDDLSGLPLIKQMKFRPKIGRADLDHKLRAVGRWLDEGHDVRLTVMFRGREVTHPEFGRRLIDPVLAWPGVVVLGNGVAMKNGRDMTVTIRRSGPPSGVREPRRPKRPSPLTAASGP